MKYSNIVLLFLEKKIHALILGKFSVRNNSSFQKFHQKAGLRREKKSLASIYEILLEIEEHSFDIDRIKGVEKSRIAGEGGGGEEQKLQGQRLLREMRKRLARGFISSRLSGNRKRLRARKSFVELVGEISIRSKSMK